MRFFYTPFNWKFWYPIYCKLLLIAWIPSPWFSFRVGSSNWLYSLPSQYSAPSKLIKLDSRTISWLAFSLLFQCYWSFKLLLLLKVYIYTPQMHHIGPQKMFNYAIQLIIFYCLPDYNFNILKRHAFFHVYDLRHFSPPMFIYRCFM